MRAFRHRLPAVVPLLLLTAIACNDSSGIDSSGVVRVSLAVVGVDRDPDGFEVAVDGGDATAITDLGSMTLALDAGEHTLLLGGFAPNCTPAGQNPLTFTINPADTTRIAVSVNCVAITGVIEVLGSAAGSPLDLDGYRVDVDGDSSGTLLPNGILRIADVVGGTHSVDVGGLAANCTEISPHPVQVEVRVGGLLRDTSRVAVVVECAPTTGSIRVSATATGTDPDSAFLVSIDGDVTTPLAAGASIVLGYLSPGNHAVELGGIAGNCAVQGPNPVVATVVIGDTTQVAFSLLCASTAVRVTAVTTGESPDLAYNVAIDGGTPVALASGASVVVAGLSVGNHSVLLSSIASNCTVAGPNPNTVTTALGDTVDVVFNVSCIAAPQTGVNFVLTTTGSSLDTLYHVTVFGGCGYYCYTPVWEENVPSNGTASASLPVGYYEYSVTQIAPNCTGPTYGSFSISVDQGASVSLAFTCATYGSVVVSVQANGTDIDPNYAVTIDGVYRSSIAAGGAVSLDVPVGAHAVGLASVAPNCTVTPPNPASVTVDSAATSHVDFVVTCAPNPTLQVTVTTTGPNAPPYYLVGVDPDYYYGYSYSNVIAPNGAASIGLPPGTHWVTLDQVPGNCTVTSANNVQVNMVMGSTTNLAFAVTCH